MEPAPFAIIPKCSIHPSRINIYSEVIWFKPKPRKPKHEHLLSNPKKHNGVFSSQASRKLGRSIDYLLFMSNDKVLPASAIGKSYKFKIAFITLTLPSGQIHPDNVIKSECLNQFLIEIRKRYKVRNYIWRSEKQANKNIHFHLLIDKFIPWSELRDRWNRIINKLGYVDRYRTKMLEFHRQGFRSRSDLLKVWPYASQVKAYQTGSSQGWHSPNTTDIHSLQKVKKIKDYFIKYFTKSEQSEGLSGRMWGSNYELSRAKGATEILDSSLKDEISLLVNTLGSKVYSGDYFTCIDVSVHDLNSCNCDQLFKLFSQYMLSQFDYNVQSKTFT